MSWISMRDSEKISFYFGNTLIEVPRKSLVEGTVFDNSDGSFRTLRIWMANNNVYVLHLVGHDIAWAHNIYILPLPFEVNEHGFVSAASIKPPLPVHQYLAQGGGIPAAPKKG